MKMEAKVVLVKIPTLTQQTGMKIPEKNLKLHKKLLNGRMKPTEYQKNVKE